MIPTTADTEEMAHIVKVEMTAENITQAMEITDTK